MDSRPDDQLIYYNTHTRTCVKYRKRTGLLVYWSPGTENRKNRHSLESKPRYDRDLTATSP